MKYVKGDIIALAKSGEYDVVVHGCNCFHTMGSGVARAIREEWPEAYEADLNFSPRGDWAKLGTCSTAVIQMQANPHGEIAILNAYTQYSFGSGKHVEYCAIRDVFNHITFYTNYNKILIPKIGAGLGGGDWKIIEEIIDRYNLDITCCLWED